MARSTRITTHFQVPLGNAVSIMFHMSSACFGQEWVFELLELAALRTRPATNPAVDLLYEELVEWEVIEERGSGQTADKMTRDGLDLLIR